MNETVDIYLPGAGLSNSASRSSPELKNRTCEAAARPETTDCIQLVLFWPETTAADFSDYHFSAPTR